MRDKTILVTGGAHGDVPLILAARRRGLRVVTSGNRPNDPGHSFSHAYMAADYTSSSDLLSVALSCEAEFIAPSCHDLAAIAAAEVAQALKLPGYDTPEVVRLIHTKSHLRQELHRQQIRTPKFVMGNRETLRPASLAQLGFPIMVKPVDLTGGRGISLCRTIDELPDAIGQAQGASRSGRVLLEEFITGTDHALSTIVVGGRVHFFMADDEYHGANRFRVHGTVYPSSLPLATQLQVCDDLERFCQALGLVDGLIHCQLKWNGHDYSILEICRRSPGDFYPWFVDLATGFDYSGSILEGYLGGIRTPAVETGLSAGPRWFRVNMGERLIRHVTMPRHDGYLQSVLYRPKSGFQLLSAVEWRPTRDAISDWRNYAASVSFIRDLHGRSTHEIARLAPEMSVADVSLH